MFSVSPADRREVTSAFLCVSGFHRSEDMKAIDVLPILKEKVAFLSGQRKQHPFNLKCFQMYLQSVFSLQLVFVIDPFCSPRIDVKSTVRSVWAS